MRSLSRRGALRAAAGVAGGVGLTTLAAAPASAATPTSRTFVLHASGLRVVGAGRARSLGEQFVVSGTVSATSNGAAIGTLLAHATTVARHDLLENTAGTLQTHTFVLADGTLIGTGLLSHHGSGDFAITGGTGAYHGVYGSYHVQQELDSIDARGTYSFVLSSREATL